MQITVTNLSSTNPVFVSSMYTTIAASASITTKRTIAQVAADQQLISLITSSAVSIAFTEETGDDVGGLGDLDPGVASTRTIRKTFTAGAGGSADDVVIYTASAPFPCVIVDVVAIVSTAVSGSTLTLRDTAAGAGTALSDALASATTGVKRNTTATTAPAVARNGSLIIRRSDSGIAGQVIVTVLRTS